MSGHTQTIRNGQTIRLNILSGQSVAVAAVTGTYNASIVQGAGLGVIATAATGATYGPYATGIVILLTASAASEIDFAIAVTPVVVSDSLAKFNAAGTALVGQDGVEAKIGSQGLRTVLFGDSMTDWYTGINGFSTATYSQATGDITFTYASEHGLWDGAWVQIFRYIPESLKYGRMVKVIRDSALVFRVNLPDKPTDLADGSVAVNVHLGSRRFSQSFVHLWQLRNKNQLNIVHNAGHSADPAETCRDRMKTEVLAYNPDIVIMQCPGVNDQSEGQTYTLTQTLGYLKDIFDTLSKANITVFAGTITPVAAGESRDALGTMRRVQTINAWIKDYAKQVRGLHVFDTFSAIINPTDSNGRATGTLLNATDRIHYHTRGALLACKKLEEITSKVLSTPIGTLPISTIDSHRQGAITTTSLTASGTEITVASLTHRVRPGEQVIVTGATPSTANGVFTCTSATPDVSFKFANTTVAGAVTGATTSATDNVFQDPLLTFATGGYTSNGTTGVAASTMETGNQSGTTAMVAVASVAAAPSGFGNEQLLTITTGIGADRPFIGVRADMFLPLSQVMVPGNTYEAECAFRMTSTNWAVTLMGEIRFSVEVLTVSGNRYFTFAIDNSDATTVTYSEDMSIHVKMPPLTIPAGDAISTAKFFVYARVLTGWSTATLVMGLSQIAIRPVAPSTLA